MFIDPEVGPLLVQKVGGEVEVVSTRQVTSEEQGEFLEVPFYVPEGTEELHVSCRIGSPEAVIDIGVADPSRVRGWSGSARKEFFLKRDDATPGYLKGDLPTGGWAVLLGAYRVPAKGCAVTVTVRCVRTSPQWIKGDLHTHTVHSDGTYELPEVERIAAGAGLDFIGTTDHNTASQNMQHPSDSRIVFIPAMELTTYKGHCNLFGVQDPLLDFRATTQEQLRQRLAQARKAGARISLNHPYDPGTGWDWDFDVDHDWVEVWNGRWRRGNQETLDWWQGQLSSGRRLVAVGGSDTHRPDGSKHGSPTTWVYADTRSVSGILGGIDRGRVFITHSPEGPVMDLRYGKHMMGDRVGASESEQASTEVRLTIHGLLAGDVVRMLSDQGVEQETTVPDGESGVSLGCPPRGWRFVRAEVWRRFPGAKQPQMAAMSNPIYFGSET